MELNLAPCSLQHVCHKVSTYYFLLMRPLFTVVLTVEQMGHIVSVRHSTNLGHSSRQTNSILLCSHHHRHIVSVYNSSYFPVLNFAPTYSHRRVFWDAVVKLMARGYMADSAIDRISGAYGRRLSVTQVINQMNKDRMLGVERWL